MKTGCRVLLWAAWLTAGGLGRARTIDPPYEVATWPGFRQAAVSYTFDDGCANQFAVALPLFDELGFKLTLFTVTNWSPNWAALHKAASGGHEVASHTVTHAYLNKLTPAAQTTELKDSKETIESHIPGRPCVTLAYPYCVPGDLSLTRQHYIAARHCQGRIEPSTPADFYQISSIICGSQGSLKTAADFSSRFQTAASSKGWCVLLIHGVDNDGGYSPLASAVLRSSLEFLHARPDTFWVATFGDGVRYIQERNAVSVTETSSQDARLTVRVTDPLEDAVYSHPVTIRRPLPAGWTSAVASQNGHALPSSIVETGSVRSIQFDAVPDRGDVVLAKVPAKVYGDWTGDDRVETEDLSIFLDSWLARDANETSGADLGGDGVVNFYELAVLAENWLRAPQTVAGRPAHERTE
ncbi:MAG: polysaccharide deacetylase family protein [Phycisphaerae bacterium]|nr:polysaccharide deacetylase family protein [Phycisphaerae bacterium]